MGGKTQQRVAGNAKPSNSGRIRELLQNQQLGSGNVITFSALAAAKNSRKQDESHNAVKAEVKAGPKQCQDEKKTPGIIEPSLGSSCNQQERDSLPQASTASKDNTRLVVRRVGNRELYVRVKVTNDDSLAPSAVQTSEAGVKKPPQEPFHPEPSQPSAILNIDAGQALSDKNESKEDAKENEVKDSDVTCDFENLLDRLNEAKTLSASNLNLEHLMDFDENALKREAELMRIFGTLIDQFLSDMSIEDWDLVSGRLDKWIGWVSNTDHHRLQSHQSAFCANVLMFIHQLIVLAEKLKTEPIPTSSYVLIQSLLDDWANFSSSSMFLDLVELYLKLVSTEFSSNVRQEVDLTPIIEALAHIIVSVDTRVVISHHKLLNYLNTKVEFDQGFKKPKASIFCGQDSQQNFSEFSAICGLLHSNSRVTLVTAHTIARKTMPVICEAISTSMLIQDQEDVNDILVFPPESLTAILTSKDSIMTTLLSDFQVGDISVTIEPDTDSYACTLSYLLAWDLAIHFIVGVDKELGQCIIHSLKKLGLIQRLLDNVFKLLPPLDDKDSLSFKVRNEPDGCALGHADWNINSFLKSPLQTTVKRSINEIELIALHIYFSTALHMPVTVRKWYNNNANKRLCNLVNEYTVKHISQVICSLEMETVQAKCHERANNEKSKNLIIRARPSAKEVYAIYTRDEFKMELTIKLPLNYPLGPVQIDGGKRVGVTDLKWRSWLLQLTTFLSHQNGPILDGIDLWRTNIDKRFEGVEKCTICFSILHSNYQLPKKKCQTCANMFHNMCLYKWFESSGNSTCPLCRNPW